MLWLSVLVPVLLALALATLTVAIRGLTPAPNRYQPGGRRGVAKKRTSEVEAPG